MTAPRYQKLTYNNAILTIVQYILNEDSNFHPYTFKRVPYLILTVNCSAQAQATRKRLVVK